MKKLDGYKLEDLATAHHRKWAGDCGSAQSFYEGYRAAEDNLLGALQQVEWEREQYRKAAEGWMAAHDALKAKYEPLALSTGDE